MANSYSEPDRLITGLFHDASVLTEGTYGPDWEPDWRQLGGGDGQQPFIDHDEGNWIFWSSQSSAWKKSSNYGVGPSASMSAWSYNGWETAGAMDNGVPNAIYLPGWSTTGQVPAEVKRSFDRGVTWELITQFGTLLGAGRKGVWRIYASPYDANELLVHFPDGQRVFRTHMARGNALTTRSSWQEIYVPRTDIFIADIDFDPRDPNVLYFAYSSEVMNNPVADGSGMLFKVTYPDPSDPMNGSAIDLSAPAGGAAALPNAGVGSEALVLERGSNGGLYLGTDLGVFYSNNELLADGTGWQLLGANLPHVTCRGLEINYKANRLRAGTEGRGVWEHDLWCPDANDLQESGTYGADAFLEASNNIASVAVVPMGTGIEYRAGNEIHLHPDFHAAYGSAFHAFIHSCDGPGNSFKSMVGEDEGTAWEVDNHELKQSDALSVHPNPNKGNFTFTLPPDPPPLEDISLWNSLGGRVPIRVSRTSDAVMVTLTNPVPDGVYLLRVQFATGSLLHTKVSIVP